MSVGSELNEMDEGRGCDWKDVEGSGTCHGSRWVHVDSNRPLEGSQEVEGGRVCKSVTRSRQSS